MHARFVLIDSHLADGQVARRVAGETECDKVGRHAAAAKRKWAEGGRHADLPGAADRWGCGVAIAVPKVDVKWGEPRGIEGGVASIVDEHTIDWHALRQLHGDPRALLEARGDERAGVAIDGIGWREGGGVVG